MAVVSGVPDVVLTSADIPGTDLFEPFESHTGTILMEEKETYCQVNLHVKIVNMS